MTIKIAKYGFQLLTENGELLMEAEPANKAKLHHWLSKNGYKPSKAIVDQWEK